MPRSSLAVACFTFLLLLAACQEDDDLGGDDDMQGDEDVDTTCEGNHDIDSQDDLDAIAHCETVSGHLAIWTDGWLTDLHMPILSSVSGNLGIEDYASLATISLPSLTSVDERLSISTTSVTDVDMTSLGSVGGGLTLATPALEDLGGFSGLTVVGESLVLSFARSLDDLDGLASLEAAGSLGIIDCQQLTNVDSLSTLTSVDILYIYNNDSLTDLHGLASLESVHGDLTIACNASLSQGDAETWVSALDVGGTATVEYNGEEYDDSFCEPMF